MLKKGKQKKASIHEMSDQELDSMYNDLKKEHQELRFKLVTSTVPNVRRIRHIKKDIARILTVKRKRQLQAN